jgi:nitroreductase
MFIDLLRSRRMVRKFEDRPVEQEKLDLLVEAALRSPSSKNSTPWEFVVVTDRDRLEKLSAAKPHGAAFVKGAAAVFVVCADPATSDVWVEDASIAATLLHLASFDLGLGSCWVQLRGREHASGRSSSDYVSELLGLREGLEVDCLIAVGHPAETKEGHPGSSLHRDKVSFERYGRAERV